jgi:putative ABC transport system permease protein
VTVGFVSGTNFEMLGARLALGRGLLPADETSGEPVAVLTDRARARLFNREPAVLGRTIAARGQELTIVGVAAGAFAGLDEPPRALWTPVTLFAALTGDADPLGPGSSS